MFFVNWYKKITSSNYLITTPHEVAEQLSAELKTGVFMPASTTTTTTTTTTKPLSPKQVGVG